MPIELIPQGEKPDAGVTMAEPVQPKSLREYAQETGKELSFIEGVKLAFATENEIGSAIASDNFWLNFDRKVTSPEFDPIEHVKEKYGEHYLDYADAFTFADSDDDIQSIVKDIDNEQAIKQQLETMNPIAAMGAATLAGMASPMTFVPIAGTVGKAYKGGSSIIKGAISGAGAAGISVAAQEYAIQQTAKTREIDESAINVAASLMLGGLLGGGAGALATRAEYKAIESKLKKDLIDAENNVALPEETIAQNIQDYKDAGAAAVPRNSLEQETIQNAFGLEKKTAFLNPLMRLLNSDSLRAREVAQELAETSFQMQKNVEGIASPVAVETLVASDRSKYFKAQKSLDEQYKAYRKRLKSEGQRPLTYREFKEEVGRSNVNNDLSEIPEVQASARSGREMLEYFKNRAVEAGIYDENVKTTTAPSYLHRMWARDKITGQEAKFRQVVKNWVIETSQKQLSSLEAKIKQAEGKIKEDLEAQRADIEVLAGDMEGYADEIVDSIYDKLTGLDPNGGFWPGHMTITQRGPMKERTFNIPDALVEDFLERDVGIVWDRYSRIMATDTNLKQRFGNFDLQEQIEQIKAEQKKVRESLGELTPIQSKLINKRHARDLKDIEALRDIIRGNYNIAGNDPSNAFVRAAAMMRLWNYTTMLGGVTLSSLADISRLTLTRGVLPAIKDGIIPVIKGTKAIKLSKLEAQQAGEAVEAISMARVATIADIGDPMQRGTMFERFADNVSRGFSRATLLAQWNDFGKTISAVLSQNDILRLSTRIAQNKGITQKEKEYLASLGIDERIANSIAKNYEAHGYKDGSTYIANTESWTREAQEVFRAALGKDIRRTIITKTSGDAPLWMQGAVGKTLGQFKSFSFAAHNKSLILMAQRRDKYAAAFMINAVIMGMLVYRLKMAAAGKEPSEDPKQWVIEGIDRSGVLGIMMEANNTLDKIGMGAASLAGGEAPSRYYTRSAAAGLAGPTFGRTEDIFSIARGIRYNDLTEADKKKIRRFIPGNNLPPLSYMFSKMEQE